MTAKMSFCLQAATTLHSYDLDAITNDIEIMAKAGLDMRDAERLAVESALAKARKDRVETAAAVREQHADLYVPKKAPPLSTATSGSQYFTMPEDYIEPPRRVRETDDFAKWFGNSKAVDDNGEPVVVYQGATERLTPFARKMLGGAKERFGFFFVGKTEGSYKTPSYLSLQNPAMIDGRSAGGASASQIESLRAQIEQARANGNDGAIISSAVEGDPQSPKQYIVFSSDQFVSATEGKGLRQARRIVRGQPSINDPITPETPEFVGNMTGDLAVMPAVGGIRSKPIRLAVGAAYGPHKGFGLEHLRDNADRYRRTPPNVTPDAAENFARYALSLIRSGLEIYQDANGDVVLRDGRLKQAVVLEDRGSHYSIKTIRPAEQSMTWGQMIARKRTSPPVSEMLVPGKVESYKFDMKGEDVRIAPVVPKPTVAVKPRRQFEMPLRQSRMAPDTPEFKAWFGDSKVVNPDGTPREVYHGTTRDFTVFKRTKGNAGGDFGRGFYLTSSTEDATANYAGIGPDLASNITLMAEQIAGSKGWEYDDPRALDQAKKKLYGGADQIIPAYVRMVNPLVLPAKGYTDRRVAMKFVNAVRTGMGKESITREAQIQLMDLYEAAQDESPFDVLLAKARNAAQYAEDSQGNLIGPEVVRKAVEKAGFDGIIDNTVSSKWGEGSKNAVKMKGVMNDTTHYIAFRPEQIKSSIGNTGEFSLTNPDIRQSRTYSEDQEQQLQWLGDRANQLGFNNVDDLADKDFDQFMALAEQWREENPFNPKARAVEPAPMYASYPVENGEDIVAWAEAQGIRDIIPAEKMHITVAYSRDPVDTRDLPPARAAAVEDDGRSVQLLGEDGDIVLMVTSPDLMARWATIKDAGASYDYESYRPHITISYGAKDVDISDVEPYDGPIQLGEEEIEDLKTGWSSTLKQSRPAAGYALPGFGNGSLFVEMIQDRYNRWKQVINAVRGQGGIVNEANDFYKAEERYWGKVGAKIEDFDQEVQGFLEGLVKDKIDARSMQLYAYARHAKERNARLRALREANPNTGFDSWSGMTDEDADAILSDAHQSGLAPLFEKHHAELMKWTQGTRDLLLSDGLITQDQYDALQNSYDFYVPLKGRPDGKPDTRPGTGAGFNIRGKETTRAKGRYSEASDIIENIIADRVKALTRAGKNEVMRTFLKFVIDNPDPANWQINETAVNPVMTVDDRGNQVIKEERQILKGEDTVGIKDGGREVFVRIKDPKLVEQMRNMNHQDVGPLIGLLLMGNRMLSRLYTSLSPVFTVLNFARDITAGTIGMVGETGFSGAARMLAYWPKAFAQSVAAEAGKPPAEYQLFRATGGKTGFMDFKTIEDLAKDLSNRVRDAERSNLDPRKFGPKTLELIESINGSIENSTRLAAFMAARDSGKTVAEAGSIAKNITVNFNRKGTMTNNLAAWFLFFNPAVQGTTRVMQALKSPKVLATLGAGMSGLAMLAMQNALVGDDDDGVAWWDKIPEEVKDRNIVIVLPPGSKQGEAVPGSKVGRYIKIPMPYGYNFFATVARLAVDRYRNGLDPARGATMAEAAKRATGSFLGAYMPAQELSRSIETPKSALLAAVPDFLNAPAQAVLNINQFGRPMYPDNMGSENLSDSSKFFAGQAGTIFQRAATTLNEKTGGNTFKSGMLDFTPATLENLARSYGGGPVSFALDLANMAYARQSIERPEIDIRRSPFIKQLYGEIDAETDRQAGFQRMDKIHEAIDPIKAALSAGKMQEAKEMYKEAGPIATLGGALKVTTAQMTALRKQELAIVASDKSDAEKYARLQEISARKRAVFLKLNQAFDAAMRRPTPALELTAEP